MPYMMPVSAMCSNVLTKLRLVLLLLRNHRILKLRVALVINMKPAVLWLNKSGTAVRLNYMRRSNYRMHFRK